MYLTKAMSSPNGAYCTHHSVERVLLESGTDFIQATIHSWPTEASRLAGNPPLWQHSYVIPLSSMTLSGGLREGILAAILGEAPWSGATSYIGQPATLEGLQALRWADIKGERSKREFSTFIWDGSEFDCDEISQRRISNYAAVALDAIANSTAFSEVWTLADNSTRTLTAAEMVEVNNALVANTSSLFATGRSLYDQIYAPGVDETDLAGISWPP